MSNSRRKMAKRFAKRADIDEKGVTISFGFRGLWSALWLNAIEEFGGAIPIVGGLVGGLVDLISLITFPFHRVVLVTDQHAYVYKCKAFHRPGEQLGVYPLGEDTVTRKRGKLTFPDGQVVWHSPFLAWRPKQVAKAIQQGHTTQTMAAA